jgi:hypothetical protein
MSAGVATDGPIDDAAAQCVVDRARGWRMDDPHGHVAKATTAVIGD